MQPRVGPYLGGGQFGVQPVGSATVQDLLPKPDQADEGAQGTGDHQTALQTVAQNVLPGGRAADIVTAGSWPVYGYSLNRDGCVARSGQTECSVLTSGRRSFYNEMNILLIKSGVGRRGGRKILLLLMESLGKIYLQIQIVM